MYSTYNHIKAILCRQWRKNKKFFWNLLNFEKCDYGVCCNEKWAVTVVQMFLYLSYLKHRIVWTSIWNFFFKIETKLYYQLCYDIHLVRGYHFSSWKWKWPLHFLQFFYTSYSWKKFNLRSYSHQYLYRLFWEITVAGEQKVN